MKQETTELQTAIDIAKKAHAGQVDKQGIEYFLHPLTVSSMVDGDRAKIAAILHDVIEDTNVTYDELVTAGIGEDILVAVDCLTKQAVGLGCPSKGGSQRLETWEENLKRIATNDTAIEVKFADMFHNMDTTRWSKEKKEEAERNAEKYFERIVALIRLVGKAKARRYIRKELCDKWFGDA